MPLSAASHSKKPKKLPQLTADPFLADEGLHPSMTGYKAAVTFLSLLQHDTVAVCVSRANTELSVDSGSGRITTLLNSPTTQPPPSPLLTLKRMLTHKLQILAMLRDLESQEWAAAV